MSWAELAIMVEELQPLVRLTAQRIIQPDQHSVALRLMRHWVLISALPGFCRALRLNEGPTAPQNPPAFCMLLRKHLLNQAISRITLMNDDRVVHLSTHHHLLVAELFGARPCLLLLDSQHRVLGAASFTDKQRHAQGQTYVPPPKRPVVGSLGGDPRFLDASAAESYYRRVMLDVRKEALQARLARVLRKAERTLQHINKDLLRCEEGDHYRTWADLLLAQQHGLKHHSGQQSIVVSDLFSDGEPLTVPLDPALDLIQNAQRLYKKHRKLVIGLEHARRRMAQQCAHRSSLLDLRQQINKAGDPEKLDSLTRRLEILNPKRSANSRIQSPRLPYRDFTTRDGSTILVGRSAQDNHQLTFHHGRGRDMWLHTRDLPGSHGIIRMEGPGEPSHETLLDAATLVAHFSRIHAGQGVDITYALRKHVRPASGGNPGQVYVAKARTLHLKVDQERLTRLLKS